MFEKLLTLLAALIVAIEANTAAQLGKAPAKGKKETAAEPKSETPANPPAAPAAATITKVELCAIAQKILDTAAAKAMTGDQAGASRIKVVNTKHGFKASTAEGQPQDKLAAFKVDLEAVLAEVEAAAESAV